MSLGGVSLDYIGGGGTATDVPATPGFTWGKSGVVGPSTWLLNDTVPSNKTGRRMFLNNATLKKIFISNEVANTFDVGVYEHDGVTYTLIKTLSLTAQRNADFDATESLTTGKEIAVRITSGTCKNVQVGVIIEGDFV